MRPSPREFARHHPGGADRRVPGHRSGAVPHLPGHLRDDRAPGCS
ncbi:MAG: hypothetical protein U5L11_14120 [Arhodomonas sp.]|nr:hypothetical protein [Arhodomonas sp.]